MFGHEGLEEEVEKVRERYYSEIDTWRDDQAETSANFHWATILKVMLLSVYLLAIIGLNLFGVWPLAVLNGILGVFLVWRRGQEGMTYGYAFGGILLMHPVYTILSIFGLDLNIMAAMIGVGAGFLSLLQPNRAAGQRSNTLGKIPFNAAALLFLPLWIISGVNLVLSTLAGNILGTGFFLILILTGGLSVFLFQNDNIIYALGRYLGTVSFFFSAMYIAETGRDARTRSDEIAIVVLMLWFAFAAVVGGWRLVTGEILGGLGVSLLLALGGPWAAYVGERAVWHRMSSYLKQRGGGGGV